MTMGAHDGTRTFETVLVRRRDLISDVSVRRGGECVGRPRRRRRLRLRFVLRSGSRQGLANRFGRATAGGLRGKA